ncbi:cytochrome P450 [Actinokineospora guangxiensis]|uniref:Cytochrome P450 n=1 Tax=Actinokineospora guangxiensis TaxID=1490288 RepID=A0ABW0EVJ6_9PSEU
MSRRRDKAGCARSRLDPTPHARNAGSQRCFSGSSSSTGGEARVANAHPDLMRLTFWEKPQEERDRAFARLRDEPRPAFFPTDDGRGFYALTRHADVVAASRDPGTFSSEPISTSLDDPPESVRRYAGSMISLDAPRHTRLRRIVARSFTPRMADKMSEDIASTARQIVSEVAVLGQGEFDFIEHVATPMTMRVVCRILGIPESRYGDVRAASELILAAGDPDHDDREAFLLSKYVELHELTRELVLKRLHEPADDLITQLCTANVDDECLTQEEVGKFFTLLIVAGTETTRNALAHAIWLLTTRPEQRAYLFSDMENRVSLMSNEVVRYSTPINWMRRNVTREVECFGGAFQPGDRVVMFYNSANRDGAVFDRPDEFIAGRTHNPHVGFGALGPHYCLGVHLAIQQMNTLLKELFTRFPDFHSTAGAVRQRSSFVNGYEILPCSV